MSRVFDITLENGPPAELVRKGIELYKRNEDADVFIKYRGTTYKIHPSTTVDRLVEVMTKNR